MIKPLIHYVGGKRQLLLEIRKYIPKIFNTYHEPFIGGGAVLFDLQPKRAIVNDLNLELIDCYREVRDHLNDVLTHLSKMKNTEIDYYYIRNLDREKCGYNFDSSFHAARFIYLNRNCFNGLYRVNSKGQFNVPYGKHKGEFVPDVDTLIDVSKYLQINSIEIHSVDFEHVVKTAKEKDFMYLDPPYDTISSTANFTSYTKEGFTKNDQVRLRDCFKDLTESGCYCMLSNAGTDFIQDLYKDYNIIEVQANRVLNCNAKKRGKIDEVLVLNYDQEVYNK